MEWKEFLSGPPIIEALNGNGIDVGHSGDAPVVFAQSNRVPFALLAITDASPESAGIVVPEGSPLKTLVSPTLAALMTATFDRLSGGRVLINVVTGGDPVELAGDGVFHSHDERYEITDEFLHIWRGLLAGGEVVNFAGDHLRVEGARTLFPTLQRPYPALYFGGSSPAGIEVAARHMDHYLTWGEPPAAVAEKIATVRAAAQRHGRQLRFGVRLHLIMRETEDEAWADADRLISRLTDKTVATAQPPLDRQDSQGQKRMLGLQGTRGTDRSREALTVSPNLWAGVGLVRGGAGTALVGSADNLAARMRGYAGVGIETFILSGYPHLEEAHRCAELLFPWLPLTHDEPGGATAPLRPTNKGETVANGYAPRTNGTWLVPLALILFWQLSVCYGLVSGPVLPAPPGRRVDLPVRFPGLLLILCVLGLVAAAKLSAHETWLLPASFAVPVHAEAVFELTSGMAFPANDYAIRPERVARSGLRLGTDPASALKDFQSLAHALRLTATLPRAGLATVWVELHPRTLTLADDKVEEYLDEIGATAATRDAWARQRGRRAWRETYVKHAKTFVGAGGEDGVPADPSWRAPVGMALELVPRSAPQELRAGEMASFQLLAKGKPLAGAPVGLLAEGAAHRTFQTTDAEGCASFPLVRAGRLLVFAVNLRLAGDGNAWESDFATLTLRAQER